MREQGRIDVPRGTTYFILGPTGSGKSALAVAVAELLGNAEIVSADAYQVYRGLPILTAAPSKEERERIPHHLVECMELAENNDAATHARRAGECIRDIHARGKVAIVSGGSGLYVKFISHGISPAPPSSAALRAELEARPFEEVVEEFRRIDPEGAATTNLQNPRYVIRNLEIVLLGGKPLSHWKSNWTSPIGAGLHLVWETPGLDARIARRAKDMLAAGVVQEVADLQGRVLSDTAVRTLGLPQIQAHLRGEISAAALESSLALATRQYAKRQRTWLRRETWLHALPAGEDISLLAQKALNLLLG